MLKELKRRIGKLSENLNNKIEIIKKMNQSEMKNTISKMKNTLEGINRLDETEGQINDLEDKIEENTPSEKQKEKRIKKYEDSLRGPWAKNET